MKKNSKKLLSALLATVMVLCSLPFVGVTFSASAEDGRYSEEYYTYTVENGEATIMYCNTSIISGDVVIPDTLGGYPVTNIGDYAFRDCTSLTSVTIPDSVTSIGRDAFYRCTGLTSITIPDSVTSIGKDAFLGCTGLT
ncbi:MAG: leucine-rich repeat domain-containing protein, partial [Clostridiaceae bacterium]|nr:leucine-rich repeat domain-containing protein [Clostridiaceae bacterium]